MELLYLNLILRLIVAFPKFKSIRVLTIEFWDLFELLNEGFCVKVVYCWFDFGGDMLKTKVRWWLFGARHRRGGGAPRQGKAEGEMGEKREVVGERKRETLRERERENREKGERGKDGGVAAGAKLRPVAVMRGKEKREMEWGR